MDQCEQLREKLRLEIYAKDNRIRQKEEKLIDSVMSFEEIFEKQILKVCSRKKHGKKSLQDWFMEQGTINNFSQKVVLKNNILQQDIKTQVQNIVKSQDENLYKEVVEYADNLQIKLVYANLLCYDFVGEYVVNYITPRHGGISKYDISKHSRVNVKTDVVKFEQSNRVLNFANNGMIKKLDYINIAEADDVDFANLKMSKCDMNKIYRRVKKQIIKDIESDKKAKLGLKKYTLVGANIFKFDCTHVLLPCYEIRVKKPGFDINFAINANSKNILK